MLIGFVIDRCSANTKFYGIAENFCKFISGCFGLDSDIEYQAIILSWKKAFIS